METPPPEVVEGRRPCTRCGYMLEGLPTGGPCPECGEPVSSSVRRPMLSASDPGFVAKLAQGAAVVFWSVVLVLVAGLVMVGVAEAAPGLSEGLAFGMLAACGGFLAGWWRLTTPEDGDAGARRRVRVCMGVLLGLAAVATVAGGAAWITPGMGLALDASVSSAVGVFLWSGMRYVRGLAARLGDERQFRWSGRLARLWLAWVGGELVRAVVTYFYIEWMSVQKPGAGSLAMEPMALAMMGANVAMMLFGAALYVLYLVHMARLRAGLRSAMGAAVPRNLSA